MQPSIAKRLKAIKWSDLHTVLVVSRAASIKKAAVELKTTESTVSRRVSAVEALLAFHVFERTPMGMIPTDAGEQLLEHLGRAEAEVEQGLETAANQESTPRGVVRVTSVPVLINRVLIPASREFLTRYPEIELEVIGAPADLSMSRREADIAVRLTRPSNEQRAVTRKIGVLDYGVFALKEAVREDGANLPWLTYDHEMSRLPQAKWVASRVEKLGEPISALKFNDAEHLRVAVQAGFGKAVLPLFMTEWSESFAQLEQYSGIPSREIWLMVHPNVLKSKKIRVTMDWISRCFAKALKPGVP